MANYTPTLFALALLKRLSAPTTRQNVQAIVGWEKAEGGNWNNDARFNPLNTTQNMPGAGNTGSQGNIKVYTSWEQGLDATVRTLKNGLYTGIISALRKGDNANAVGSAITNSPWGTGGLAAQVIRQTKIGNLPSLTAVPGVAALKAPTAPAAPTGPTSVPDVAARGAAVRSFLFDKAESPLDFASQIKAIPNIQIAAPAAPKAPKPPTTPKAPGAPKTSSIPASAGGVLPADHSQLFELIHNTGNGPGFGVKNGQIVNGAQVFSGVWAGHRDHVHVAAGPNTVVALGHLAQKMGLTVSENPHFGGVHPVHVPGSYHYRNEAIDVSGSDQLMNQFARRVEQLFGLKQ